MRKNQRYCTHGEILGLQVSKDAAYCNTATCRQSVPSVEESRLGFGTVVILKSSLCSRPAKELMKNRRNARSNERNFQLKLDPMASIAEEEPAKAVRKERIDDKTNASAS